MSDEASPRPWHFNGMRPTIYSDEKLPDGSARVVLDIETDHLPLLPCDENDRQLIADIALIVAAVNERDRLRAALQEIIRKVGSENYANDDGVDPVDVLEIARSAIGEDAK